MSSEYGFQHLLKSLEYSGDHTQLPDDLIPFIGFLLGKASQQINAEVDSYLSTHGLTTRHYGIMLLLSRESGLQQITIGETLRIDRTTMVKLVDNLVKLDIVERHRDPNDRRAYALALSDKGEKLLPEITQHVVELEQLSLSNLTHEEVHQFFQLLLKIVAT